jgi:SAM-dependent methyltransferase
VEYVVDCAAPHLGGNIRGGDPHSWEPALWAWLRERYAPRVVLDLGCGEGHAAAEFARLGCTAIGLDGLGYNAAATAARGVPCLHHDLTRGPLLVAGVDLAWCCEVVEHVAPEHVGALLGTLATARVVTMTHAVPNQGGWHHVNCQPADYWIGHLAAHGYTLQDAATTHARTLARGWFRHTGLIFTRDP